MNEPHIPRPDPEHRERLAGVHPRLVAAVTEVLPVMAILGHPMFVVEGVRTTAQQAAHWAKGRTVPGPDASPARPLGRTVSNVDGTCVRSAHQADPKDGYGRAVDLAFQGPEPWATTHPWGVYGALVKWHGLRWGGDWKSIVDCPHAELPEAPGGAARVAVDGTTQTSSRPSVG